MYAFHPPTQIDPAAADIASSNPHWRLDAEPRPHPARRPRRRRTQATLLLTFPLAVSVSWLAGLDPIDLLRMGYTSSIRTLEGLARPEPNKIATGDPSARVPADAVPPALDPPAMPRKPDEPTVAPGTPQGDGIPEPPRDARKPEEATVPKAAPPSPAEHGKRSAAASTPPEHETDGEPASTIPPPPAALTAAQRKAEAAGLHTGLSRVLIERLTASDYRNASEAIRRALASPREDDIHVWPPRPGLASAQFTVRFVAGAPSGCRRYVVTILKDRWETTALPMERCAHRQSAPQMR